jgi:IS30 family transposase
MVIVLFCPLVKKNKNMKHITSEQRYTIYCLLQNGHSITDIAKTIGKHKSTICREIKRNANKTTKQYDHILAHKKYKERMKNKPKRIKFTQQMKDTINQLLQKKYSPEQIVGYCRKNNIQMVSPERIYQYIWADKKNGGTLYKHLRTEGKRYRKRGLKKDKRGVIPNRRDISERPAIVEQKKRFGDFEVDTIIGKNHKGAIVTMVDRATGLLKMKKVPSKDANIVAHSIIQLLSPLKPFIHTITADNGKEFAEHISISKSLSIDFFFAKPYHSWERGANENINRLIRQYIPKKTDINSLSDDYIQWVEEEINNRPRKRFHFDTPISIFNQLTNNTRAVAFVN